MKNIKYKSTHRQKHFDFFTKMDQPHFNVCANVDITAYKFSLKQDNYPFTPAIVYLISRVANAIPEFRHRIRNNNIIEHETVHPSFSVLTDVTNVFSFCYVDYQPNFKNFVKDTIRQMERMKTSPSIEDEPGRDDYLFLSAFPWASFTAIMHPMHYSPVDSVPRIVWGKYFKEGNRLKMPLSVQAHHAVVDGLHVGQYFQKIQELLDQPELVVR